MPKIIDLGGFNVEVVAVPPDDGGGRMIVYAAYDGSEIYKLRLDDEAWETIVENAKRIHTATPEDLRHLDGGQ